MKARIKSLVVFAIFCLILLISSAYSVHTSFSREQQVAIERVDRQSFLIAEWIRGAFESVDYVLRDIVEQVPVSELLYPHPDPAEHARISELIDAKRSTLPHAISVGLSDRNCIITHTPAVVGFDAGDREWCRTTMDNPELETYVSRVFASNIGEPMVIQSRQFPGDGYVGVAGIGVNLQFFLRWVDKISVNPDTVIAIVDTGLTVVAIKPKIPGLQGSVVSEPLLESFLSAPGQSAVKRATASIDRVSRVYSARKIEGIPFMVVVGIADRAWMAGWWQNVWITLVALVLSLTLAVFLLRAHWSLLEQQNQLFALAHTDPLTGIANHRGFFAQAEAELKKSARYHTTVSMLLLDIDNFKSLNDNYGHDHGNDALAAFIQCCQDNLRDLDVLGRLGGDEFAVLAPNTDREGAQHLAERLVEALRAQRVNDQHGVPIVFTASIGVVAVRAFNGEVAEFISLADKALYEAKRNGRDQVVVHEGF